MVRFLLVVISFALLSSVALANEDNIPSANDGVEICYFPDEELAESILNFFFSQGFAAVRCDVLVGTEKFERLHNEVFESHADAVDTFTSPIEKMLARNDWERKDYVESLAQNTFFLVNGMQMNKVSCDRLFQEMRTRKDDWDRIVSQIISERVMMDDSAVNRCQVE